MSYKPLHTPLRTTWQFTPEQVEHLTDLVELVASTNTLDHYHRRSGLAQKVQAGTATVDDFIYLWAFCTTDGAERWVTREKLTHSLYIQLVWDRFDDYFLAVDAAHAAN